MPRASSPLRFPCAVFCLLSRFAAPLGLAPPPATRPVSPLNLPSPLRHPQHNTKQQVPLEQFIITKALTKRPEDYPDGNNQPHVQVALRRIKQGKRDGVASGETVPYVVCVEVPEGTGGLDAAAAKAALEQPPAGGKALAERAYHPEEIVKGASSFSRAPFPPLHISLFILCVGRPAPLSVVIYF